MFANLFYTCKEFRIAIHVLQNQQLTKKQSKIKENFDGVFSQENQCFCLSNISTGQTLDKF